MFVERLWIILNEASRLYRFKDPLKLRSLIIFVIILMPMSLFHDHQVKMMAIKVTAIGHRNFYGAVTVTIPIFGLFMVTIGQKI